MNEVPLWRRLASNSLLHFLLVGGLCFALAPPTSPPRQIHIAAAQLRAEREAQRQRLGQTRLTPQQRAEVERRVIHDAILHREAQRLGLGAGDAIVKQRMIQKMLFLTLRLAGANRAPTTTELRAWYQRTRLRWMHPARYQLMHIYFRTHDAKRIKAIRQQAIDAANRQPPKTPPRLGDSFPLPRHMPLLSVSQLKRRFGNTFATALPTLPLRRWSQPIASRYGTHIIWLQRALRARPQSFQEAKESLRFQWILNQKKRAKAQLLKRLYKSYRISVDGFREPPYQPK